jgi:hypothetical protein
MKQRPRGWDAVDSALGEWWGNLPVWGIALVYLATMFVIIATIAFIAGLIRG